MQQGQDVRYYSDPDAASVSAQVVEIVGAGSSLAKRLDLSYRVDGEVQTAEDVPHQPDAEKGEHFWLMKGERKSESHEDEAEAEPVELAVPDGARVSPAIEKKAAAKRK